MLASDIFVVDADYSDTCDNNTLWALWPCHAANGSLHECSDKKRTRKRGNEVDSANGSRQRYRENVMRLGSSLHSHPSGVSEMAFRVSLAAVLIMTLGACQMETGGQGFNPGAGSGSGFNPGSGARPPYDPGESSRPSAGIELARDVCTREAEQRGRDVRVLSSREVRGGAEVMLRVRTGPLFVTTQRLRCHFDYGTGRASVNRA